MKDNISTTIEHDEVILIGSMHNNSTVDQAVGIELSTAYLSQGAGDERCFICMRQLRPSSDSDNDIMNWYFATYLTETNYIICNSFRHLY